MIPVRIPHVLLAALISIPLCVCVVQGPEVEYKQKVQCDQRWPGYGWATELNQQNQIHQKPNSCNAQIDDDHDTVGADDDSLAGADEDTVGSPVTTGDDTTKTDDDDTIEDEDGMTEEFPPAPPLVCEKDNGFEPPPNLKHFMTSLLHERDVTHYLTSAGYYSLLGDGAYANVHLGRYMRTGECVVIKRFTDSSIRVTEREIRIHSYIEQFLPNTPRLLGVVPIGHMLHNLSMVYQLVPEGNTFYDWLKVADAFSPVQWLSVALQLAENLDILHRKCVLHNDLHSSNIMLHFHDGGRYSADCGMSMLERAEDDEKLEMARSLAKVKVKGTTLPTVTFIDFGFATFRAGKVFHTSSESLESCDHLAPEVIKHAETTPASDVFSLGHELQYVAKALNFSALFDIVARCTKPDPRSRPPVRWVVNSLRKLFLHELRRSVLDYDHGVQKQSTKHSDEELSAPVHDSFVLSSGESLLWSSARKRSGLQKCAKSLPERNAAETFDGRCYPELFEDAVSKLRLPYITYTKGDLLFQEGNGKSKNIFFESNDTSIDIGIFESSGEKVVIKRLKSNDDYSTVRYEAMMNLFLHETGWVPRFYGVVPTGKYRNLESLGIVQEFFAKGVTLAKVLKARRPFGVTPRVRLALQLTSLMLDVHSRHMLINSLSENNIICACMNDSHCLDVKLIDLGKAGGCEGRVFRGDMSTPFHTQLAPEVRHNGMTSFASDIFSLCVILNNVLERQALLRDKTRESREEVEQFLSKWAGISKLCSSRDPSLRPSLFQLRHFFATFVSSR